MPLNATEYPVIREKSAQRNTNEFLPRLMIHTQMSLKIAICIWNAPLPRRRERGVAADDEKINACKNNVVKDKDKPNLRLSPMPPARRPC
jgi:hypothetical protein